MFLKTLQVADSLHLDLKQLLGIPCLPYVVRWSPLNSDSLSTPVSVLYLLADHVPPL